MPHAPLPTFIYGGVPMGCMWVYYKNFKGGIAVGNFFDDTMQGMLEAVETEKWNIPLVQREDMPAPTFTASDKEKELIDEIINLRKEQKMSQSQLAKLTGNKQQAISRIENKEHSPSLKLFYSIVRALGYDLKIVKI